MASGVPGIDSTPQISESVPGVQFPFRQEFGKEGVGLGHLGEGIERAAAAGGDIYDEIQRQHDISTAGRGYTEASVSHAQQLQQLELTSPDGFIHDNKTGEVIKNSDGSQRTISQEYWGWADDDFRARQDQMTPRAAAIFRTAMQREIADNAKILQNEGLKLQIKQSDQMVGQNMGTLARANDTNPWADQNSYYADKQSDGSVIVRGNLEKINGQLRALQLQTAQQGPTKAPDGTMLAGAYNPTQVSALTAQRLSEHSDRWVQSALTNIIENDGPRDKRNVLSTTALQQLYALRDVVEGKDPQSKASEPKGLPTVHSSLTAEQIDKWRTKIDGLRPDAKEIDKGDYEAYKKVLGETAQGVRNMNEFLSNPVLHNMLHSAIPLEKTPGELVKDVAEPFANAVIASALAGTNKVASADTKQALVNKTLQTAKKQWTDFVTKQIGFKGDTSGFGDAVIARASKEISRKLDEDARHMREDPIGYMSENREGPQGGENIAPKVGMSRVVSNKLRDDPSALAIFSPAPGGRSVLEEAQRTANMGYHAMGLGTDVEALTKSQFQDQVKRLLKPSTGAKNPDTLWNYFNLLGQSKLSDKEKEAFKQNLVHSGGMPQPYIDALNLPSKEETLTRWTNLFAGQTPMQLWEKDPRNGGESLKAMGQLSGKNNLDVNSYIDRKFGQNSPQARRFKNEYDQAWQSDYANARMRGMGQSAAAEEANSARDSSKGAIGVAQGQHDMLGVHWLPSMNEGPPVPVEFGQARSNLDPEKKKTIQANLGHFQTEAELAKQSLLLPPGVKENPNMPMSKWVANHAFLWARIPGGYRLWMQEMGKSGQPTGIGQPVRTKGRSGYYDVSDSDAELPGGHK